MKNDDDDPTRGSSDEYYMTLVKNQRFNALIDNKPFFDQLVKNQQEEHEKLAKISRKITTQREMY